ncbi:HK97-gp10 family putative phage morphogenesis protein [Niameybacter massiliensis]|uniref:HK97-gp10 family putative phage morphogenesis protein n=1 Tax=Niameybacter massiliensis TaxID=1658108 RepID=UPI0006B509F8|nr:HK97-gp10 family putative phage morphogenesis protein [Niameybacter massiliensis]
MGANINGIDQLLMKISQLGGSADRVLDKAIMKAGKLVEGDAKDLCTVDTGRLKNSIHTKLGGSMDKYSYKDNDGNEFVGGLSNLGQNHTAIVGTNVEYAPYVECGTGKKGEASPSPPKYPGASYREDWVGQEAQPFLWPALNQNKDNIQELIVDNLKKEIRRLSK